MNETDIQGFALMVCTYSLFEYFVKRVVWKPNSDPSVRARRAWKEGAVLCVILCVGMVAFLNVQLLLCYVVVALLYASYELFGRKTSKDEAKKRSLERFIWQQILVGVLLYAVWRYALPMQLQGWYLSCERWLLGEPNIVSMWFRQHSVAILVIVSAYLSMVDGGTKIIRGMLDKFPNLYKKAIESLKSDDDETVGIAKEENAGEWIGILERIITLTFVLTGSFTAIAFALTAKSIARFKELNDKHFAEYYLLGTSGSIGIALIVGMIVKIILGI